MDMYVDKLEPDVKDVFKTRSTFVAEKIREAILGGSLKPGTKLIGDEIAESLKVSRIPVREAIQILATEGLIQVTPHHGATVVNLSLEELEEIYFIRNELEGFAARLAAPKITNDEITNLESILKNLDEVVNLDDWLGQNQRFHHSIYQAANQPRLLSIINNLRNISSPYILLYINDPKHREEAKISHQRIFEACKARDGVLAEREIKKHLKSVLESVITNMQSNQSQTQNQTLNRVHMIRL
jgi:DNA-binding GntR family transcriptional regulator